MGIIALDATSFGSITILGKKYDHDVYVFWNGTIERRVGDHTVPARQMEHIVKKKPEIAIIGTGQFGMVRVPSESEKLAQEQNIEVVKTRTPQAIGIFNETRQTSFSNNSCNTLRRKVNNNVDNSITNVQHR